MAELSRSILKSEFKELKPVEEKTIPEYYLAKAKHYAEQGRNYWLVDGVTDEKRYFKTFDEETRKVASAFHKLGLRKSEVVLYMTRDLCKVYLLLVGVWRANGVMRASYPDDDAETLLHRVKESKSRFIVCEEDAVERCESVAAQVAEWKVHVITNNRTNFQLPSIQQFLEEDDGADCPEFLASEEDPALILCTSGTTGMPKGAIHTHRNFLYQMRMLERNPFLLHKPNLIATKATHVSGSLVGLVIMGCGKTAVAVSNLTLDNVMNAAAKYKPGFAFAFPTFLTALANAEGCDFSCIEVIYTAGVTVTPAIKETLWKLPGLKDIVVAFGLTETLAVTTSAIIEEDDEKKTQGFRDLPDFSVGKPYPDTELQIRNPTTLEILGPNVQGEICVKTPAMFHSYLNNPKATEEAHVDGFFRTGDIGYYDEKGFVYIVDRLKEIFKYFNDHISPTDVENVIGKHPSVREVCVVGVADAGGHVPRAFVTVVPNSGPKEELAEEIKKYANGKLASYKHLRGGVYIVDELPKGKTGKISRQLVDKLPTE